MAEQGIDLEGQTSTGLEALPEGVTWDFVTMGCGDACPHLPATNRVEWELADPKELDDDGFRRVRDEIGRRVRDLLDRTVPPGDDSSSP